MSWLRLGVLMPLVGSALAYVAPEDATAQTIRYVDQNVVGGSENGLNWDNAYPDLWDAILAVSAEFPNSNVEIWVAEGTYLPRFWQISPGLSVATFPLLPRVQIYGGFPGPSAAPAERDDLNDRREADYPTILLGTIVGQPASEVEACNDEAGDCFTANMTPGCNRVVCCEAVCAFDPECCDTIWDLDCAKFAEEEPDCEPPAVNASSVVLGWEPDSSEAPTRRLDGLIITGGGNRPAPNELCGDDTRGGGVFLDGFEVNALLSMEIVRCQVTDNYAHQGGGVAVRFRPTHVASIAPRPSSVRGADLKFQI